MNIFEYLGQDKAHRKLTNKVTQLVKHWADVSNRVKSSKGDKWLVQTKKDGVCALVLVHQGLVTIWSRTGKRFTNTQLIAYHIQELDLPDGVFFGELLVPKDIASLEEFSACVSPNRKAKLSVEFSLIPEFMELHFFDAVSIAEFIEGQSDRGFQTRIERLTQVLQPTDRALLLPATLVDTTRLEHVLDVAVEADEEGIIIRQPEAGWEAGHKGWRVMKMVRSVTYDLTCIGWEAGTGKYSDKVANLIFKWKEGKTITAMLGKGWSHEMAKEMKEEIDSGEGTPVGKVFEVYALEESSKGKLRLPKVGEERHDKEEPDY